MPRKILHGRLVMVEANEDGTSLVRQSDRGIPLKELDTATTTKIFGTVATVVDQLASSAPAAQWTQSPDGEVKHE